MADQAAARINNETLKIKETEINFDDMKVYDNYEKAWFKIQMNVLSWRKSF